MRSFNWISLRNALLILALSKEGNIVVETLFSINVCLPQETSLPRKQICFQRYLTILVAEAMLPTFSAPVVANVFDNIFFQLSKIQNYPCKGGDPTPTFSTFPVWATEKKSTTLNGGYRLQSVM